MLLECKPEEVKDLSPAHSHILCTWQVHYKYLLKETIFMLWGGGCYRALGIAGAQSMLKKHTEVNTGSFLRRVIQ